MKPKEIAVYRQRLRKTLNIEDENKRLVELKQLAKEVGAGYEHTEITAVTTPIAIPTKAGAGVELHTSTHQNTISESELVLNINNALQTETMIYMCKIAARNYLIACAAAVVAFLSALAAWSAIVAVNRYAISATEGRMYILDTRTGQTWLRSASTEYNLGTTNKPIFKLVEYEDSDFLKWQQENASMGIIKQEPNN